MVKSQFYCTMEEKVMFVKTLIDLYGDVEDCSLKSSLSKIKIYNTESDRTDNLLNYTLDKFVNVVSEEKYVIEVYEITGKETLDEEVIPNEEG